MLAQRSVKADANVNSTPVDVMMKMHVLIYILHARLPFWHRKEDIPSYWSSFPPLLLHENQFPTLLRAVRVIHFSYCPSSGAWPAVFDTIFILRRPQPKSIIETTLKQCVYLSQGECTSSMVTRPQCSLPASPPQSAVLGNCSLISFEQLRSRSCRNIQSSQAWCIIQPLLMNLCITSVWPWWRKGQHVESRSHMYVKYLSLSVEHLWIHMF